nr:hypothetical protein [Candidatus Sigynarchaeota archaeon]
MGPPSGPPRGLPGAPPGGLPGTPGVDVGESPFDFSEEEIYQFVTNMENFIQGSRSKGEPFKIAQQLGFKEPHVFYAFINHLNRDDLIKFDGGKIVVNLNMTPVDAEEFLEKYSRFLKTGRI